MKKQTVVKQLTPEEILNVKVSPMKPIKKRTKRPVTFMTDDEFNQMMDKAKRGY